MRKRQPVCSFDKLTPWLRSWHIFGPLVLQRYEKKIGDHFLKVQIKSLSEIENNITSQNSTFPKSDSLNLSGAQSNDVVRPTTLVQKSAIPVFNPCSEVVKK